MKHFLILATLFTCSQTASAEATVDNVTLLGQFVQSNYAATKCLKPTPEALTRYLANFKTVSVLATEEMHKKQPGLSKQQIYAGFKKANDNVTHAMDEALQKQGCDHPDIQQVIKLFDSHVNLDLKHEPAK